MLFRSLRRLARRGMLAGAAGAVALTAFNVAQPSLGGRRVHPGTVRDVRLALAPAVVAGAPASASAPGSVGAAGAPTTTAASGPSRAGKAATAPAPASVSSRAGKAGAPATAPAVLDSPPVAVGTARFVGFSWPATATAAPGPAAGAAKAPGGAAEAAAGRGARAAAGEAADSEAGEVWLRTRTAAGWSGWREVEPAGDGPDPGSREHRPGRVFTDGVCWTRAPPSSRSGWRVQPPVRPPPAARRAGWPPTW